jgi:hypothetical protein
MIREAISRFLLPPFYIDLIIQDPRSIFEYERGEGQIMDRPKLQEEFSWIALQYGLRFHNIRSCRSLYKKTAAYRMFTENGTFLIKPFKGPQVRLNRLYSRMAWLKRNNFKNMPRWLSTSKGTHWVKSNGRLYYVSDG